MKTIFITGASRGIGLELTKQLLTEGHKVIASCRNPEDADALLACTENSDHLEIMGLQVDEENSVRSCFATLEQAGRGIDLLFNNAGIIDWDDLHAVSTESLEKVYRTNLVGALLVLRGAISCLRKSSDPLVVNLSSRLGSIALRGNTQLGGAIAYQCSKAALNMLTRQSAIDLSALGIRVVSVSPGWVRTDMGGETAKYEVDKSVRLIRSALGNLQPTATGVFIGEDGETIPW